MTQKFSLVVGTEKRARSEIRAARRRGINPYGIVIGGNLLVLDPNGKYETEDDIAAALGVARVDIMPGIDVVVAVA